MDNVVEQFRLAIREAGLKPPDDIEPDGQLRHLSTNGSATDKAGWCVLFDGDVPAGAFGDFRSGVDEKWRGAIGRRLTSQEKAEQKRRFQEARRRRDAKEAERRKAARGEAQAIWKSAKSAPEDHPYLKRKGVRQCLFRC